jgi:hypothetical protein
MSALIDHRSLSKRAPRGSRINTLVLMFVRHRGNERTGGCPRAGWAQVVVTTDTGAWPAWSQSVPLL